MKDDRYCIAQCADISMSYGDINDIRAFSFLSCVLVVS